MLFKPQWYKMLPDSVKPIDKRKIEKIEDFRKRLGVPDEAIFMGIMVTRWAVKKIHKYLFEQAKKLMPNAPEQELWKAVILSRFDAKLKTSPETDLGAKPLSPEEIFSRMENINNIISGFKSFDDVLDYIIAIDEEENRFYDPAGIFDRLNNLLET